MKKVFPKGIRLNQQSNNKSLKKQSKLREFELIVETVISKIFILINLSQEIW